MKKEDLATSYDVNIRILDLIQELGLNQSTFGQSIGTSSSRMNNIARFRNKPDFELLSKILKVYPSVNSEWLMTGEGEMYKRSFKEPDIERKVDNSFIEKRCISCTEKDKLIELQKRTIEELREQLLEAKRDKEFLKKIISKNDT